MSTLRGRFTLLFALAGLAFAQPVFEVATIKVNNSGYNAIGGRGVCLAGGTITVRNIPLGMLIEQAWDLKSIPNRRRPRLAGIRHLRYRGAPALSCHLRRMPRDVAKTNHGPL